MKNITKLLSAFLLFSFLPAWEEADRIGKELYQAENFQEQIQKENSHLRFKNPEAHHYENCKKTGWWIGAIGTEIALLLATEGVGNLMKAQKLKTTLRATGIAEKHIQEFLKIRKLTQSARALPLENLAKKCPQFLEGLHEAKGLGSVNLGAKGLQELEVVNEVRRGEQILKTVSRVGGDSLQIVPKSLAQQVNGSCRRTRIEGTHK